MPDTTRKDPLSVSQISTVQSKVNAAGLTANPPFTFSSANMSLVPGAEKLHVEVLFKGRTLGAVNVLGRTNFATSATAFSRTVDDAVMELLKTPADTV